MSDDTADVEELMPDRRSARSRVVYDIIETALYKRPEEVSIWQLVTYSLVLLMVPFVGLLVWLVGMVLTGQLTVAELMAAFQTSNPSASMSLRELGWQMVQAPFELAAALGMVTMLKLLFKLFQWVDEQQ